VYDIMVSSAITIGAFNTGLETVSLHRPTLGRICTGSSVIHVSCWGHADGI
jgi:hypothetical protein